MPALCLFDTDRLAECPVAVKTANYGETTERHGAHNDQRATGSPSHRARWSHAAGERRPAHAERPASKLILVRLKPDTTNVASAFRACEEITLNAETAETADKILRILSVLRVLPVQTSYFFTGSLGGPGLLVCAPFARAAVGRLRRSTCDQVVKSSCLCGSVANSLRAFFESS